MSIDVPVNKETKQNQPPSLIITSEPTEQISTERKKFSLKIPIVYEYRRNNFLVGVDNKNNLWLDDLYKLLNNRKALLNK